MARKKSEQTAAPLRNFTLPTEERVAAIVTGAPAWARRLKRIEELPALIFAAHRDGHRTEAAKRLAELVGLVDAHNAYYPIEANLPFDPVTSRLVVNGAPWRPMPRPTLESILAVHEEEPSRVLAWRELDEGVEVKFDDVTLRLTRELLTCEVGGKRVARVATSDIALLTTDEPLEVVLRDTTPVRLPIRLGEDERAALTTELNARLHVMRATRGGYRG